MSDVNKFKDRLKELRKDYSITQQELADKIGIVRTAIANYETGRTIPDSDTLTLLAKIFNTTTDYLLGISNIRNPYQNKNIKETPEEQDIVPEEFINADEARAYVNKHQIFGSSGFDADKLDDNEILEFANALLEQMKMVSYKYKK
ncbi:helix-turn-helix domain-containing protein [Tissierella praeacuta]|uniref:helix-turn-helix domain-containing protein n=1 Tax=Tissierella praeacuta TaxID=43131 RepID=UPI003DA48918